MTFPLFLRAPLLLPLAAVVAVLLGPWGWAVVGALVALACVGRLWRQAAASLLAALVSWGHVALTEQRAEPLREPGCAAEYTGTVTRTMAQGFVLSGGWLQPKLLVHAELPAEPGDVLRVTVLPREPEERESGSFDRVAWLRGEGIAAEADAVRASFCGHPWGWYALRGEGLRLRDKLARRLMPPGTEGEDWRRLLCAMVLGERSSAGEEMLGLFRRGGCMHVFAVSGLHAGLVAGFLWFGFRRLRVHPRVARPLILAVLAVYVLITGCAVPALRAYTMLALALGGLMLRRRVTLLNTWCAAALFTLLVAPSELYNAGFQLSFGVYAAIVLGMRICLHRDSPWFGPDAYLPYRLMTPAELWVRKAELWLRALVVVPLCAWLVALPLTAAAFGVVNPYSVLCNIVIAVPVSVCMAAGLLYLLLGGVPWLGVAAQWAAQYSAGFLLWLVACFGELPGAYLSATPPAEPTAVVQVPARYGSGCCLLGNGGLLVGCGSASSARFELLPTLFQRGCRPAALLMLPVSEAQRGGAEVLRREWPEMRVCEADAPQRITTPAGTFLICPPPADLPPTPAANRLPLVLWEQPNGYRILYAGDASALSLRALPPGERHADELILGRNPTAPFTQQDKEALRVHRVRSTR